MSTARIGCPQRRRHPTRRRSGQSPPSGPVALATFPAQIIGTTSLERIALAVSAESTAGRRRAGHGKTRGACGTCPGVDRARRHCTRVRAAIGHADAALAHELAASVHAMASDRSAPGTEPCPPQGRRATPAAAGDKPAGRPRVALTVEHLVCPRAHSTRHHTE